MTDNQKELICTIAGVNDISELSDGFHTFENLYHQRAILFAALVKAYDDKAWKSWRHEDGELCFGGGWFIVGIDTPQGSYTYHYKEEYWGIFECIELEKAKHWDGHTEKDVDRLLSLDLNKISMIPIIKGWLNHIVQIITDIKSDTATLSDINAYIKACNSYLNSINNFLKQK